MSDILITYKPQPRQIQLHTDPHLYRLLGGTVFCGKSYALFGETLILCTKFKNLQGCLVKKTLTSCIDTFLPIARRLRVIDNIAKYNANKHTLTFPATGSVITFMYCEHDNDVENFTQYDFMGIDELTTLNEWQFDMITLRVRTSSEDPQFHPTIFASTNPDKRGHAWVKRRFVTKDDSRPDYNPNLYSFIAAKYTDNPIGLALNPGYMERYKNLPPEKYKALVEGSWDIFEGQFFTEWDPHIHILDTFDISTAETIIMGGDWGTTSPCAYYWIAIDKNKNLTVFKELYHTGLTAKQQGELIANLTEADPMPYTYMAFDPHHFKPEGRMKSIAEEIGGRLIPGERNRIARANITRQWLQSRRLRITRNCENLIRTLPDLVHSDNNPEDVDTDCEDHAYDAVSHALCSASARVLLGPRKEEILTPERMQGHDDPIYHGDFRAINERPLPPDEITQRRDYYEWWE